MRAPQIPGYSSHSAPRMNPQGLGPDRWTVFYCSLVPASAQTLDVSPPRALTLDLYPSLLLEEHLGKEGTGYKPGLEEK